MKLLGYRLMVLIGLCLVVPGAAFSARSQESLLGSHTVDSDAVIKSLLLRSGYFEPFNKHVSFPFDRDVAVMGVVAVLLFRDGPPDVAGLVIPVVIDSINGMFCGGTASHVRQKSLVIMPFGANQNPAGSVMRPVDVIGIFASANHSPPGSILGRFFPVASLAMPQIDLTTMDTAPIDTIAAAAFRVSVAQHCAGHDCHLSAVTATKPANAASFFTFWFERNKATKPLIS